MVSTQKFSTYLRKPYDLDAEAEQDLREVVKKYPYFNNAWLLLARTLQNQNSPLFDESLKQAGMYAGNRALLYKLVNIDVKDEEEPIVAKPIEMAKALPPSVDVPVEYAPETTPFIDATPAPGQVADEPILEHPASTPLPLNATEEEKVASAYNEIFGGDGQTESNVSEEFEQFDINEPFYPSKVEEGIEEEEEFLLHVDEPLQIETPEIAAKQTEVIEDTTPTTTSEEEFEIKVGEHLDTDHDGIIAPQPTLEKGEEELELAIVDNIAATTAPAKSEEEFELKVGEHLDTDHDGVIAPQPTPEKSEEELELAIADIVAETKPAIEEPETIAASEPNVAEVEAEEPPHEIETPIAFKLDKKPVVAEIKQEEKGVLLSEETFYEWLAHLKNPGTGPEKKNNISVDKATDIAPVAIEEEKVEAPVAVKKTSVDEIIERFITIQPSISRPKAEFYNPTLKAKVSDTEADDLATETLARIYRTQKLYDRAIEVYHKLIRSYPENEANYKAKIAEIETEKG